MRLILIFAFCALVALADLSVAGEVTRKSYAAGIATNGVVVFDVNWGRYWNCGGYENAELMKLEFDRLPADKKFPGENGDLIVEGPMRITRTLRFLNYAYLLPPGEYALSGLSIKVARSVSEVGYLNAKRGDLIKDGKAEGGTFTVAAGEIVYIGNFFLDCHDGPMLWRYYSEGKEGFEAQIAEYRAKYPFLERERFRYRLFKTKTFGSDYELPK
jgi:hypothetical protein